MMSTRLALLAVSAGLLAAQSDFDALVKSARARYDKADYAAAIAGYDEAWQTAQTFDAKDERRYQVLKQLTSAHAAARQYKEAEDYLQLAVNWREIVNGREDPKVYDELVELAAILRAAGACERAITVLDRVLFFHLRTDAGLNTKAADTMVRIALVRLDMKQPDQAAGSLNAAVLTLDKVLGVDHPSLLPVLDRLGETRITLREYDRAEQIYRRALILRERWVGSASADLLANLDGLAYALFGQKKYEEAEPVYKRLLALWESSAGPEHPLVAMTLEKMAVFYREQGKSEPAALASARSLAIRAHFLATGFRIQAEAREDRQEAAALLERALEALAFGESPEVAELRAQIQTNLDALGRRTPGRGATKAGPIRKPPAGKKKAPAKGD